ncbi:hypothetical protein B0H13DRAFT_2374611 [Mycena leptocephala]|nr:hypothetical protein B0H13DRAFT_2374611 [Mycena leptocephala]
MNSQKYEHAEMQTMLLVNAADDHSDVKIKESLLVSLTDVKVEPSFNTAILGGLLYALYELPQSAELTIHCSSNFPGKVLVTERTKNENDLLGPHFQLIESPVSALQERSGRIYFKKVKTNPAAGLQTLNPTPTTVDTQSDLMFSTPGICQGNLRLAPVTQHPAPVIRHPAPGRPAQVT